MEERIKKDIEGKNLKRVLPQARKMAKTQKERVTIYCVASVLFGSIGVAGFFFPIIPNWLQYTALGLLPFQILGAFGDHHLYKYQKAKIAYIENELG